MAKSQQGRGAEQVSLRLPPGLRDRIKAYAERHGRSMNTEIVRILESEFPEPWSIVRRMEELLRLLTVLKEGATNDMVGRVVIEIDDTIKGIINGRVKGISDEERSRISQIYSEFEERDFKEYSKELSSERDPEEIEMANRTGHPFKFVHLEDDE
uniref:Arc family DNA-binding protein n=1 Tax=Stappia sp. TaxID=1870903 RepID=UPI003BA87D81